MQDTLIRLGVLVLVAVVTWLLVQLSRRIIEVRRRQALSAAPLSASLEIDAVTSNEPEQAQVRILAFSSADCHQCHRLQAPALQRVLQARESAVRVIDVDATTEHELVQTYHVLTVPSTVILDAQGQARAVNYGFANSQRLLTQIDEVLAQTA